METQAKPVSTPKAPSLFVNHAGPPMLFGEPDALTKHLKTAGKLFQQPQAIIVISAHFEEKELTILHNTSGKLLYDYENLPNSQTFPNEAWKLTYNAISSKQLVEQLSVLFQKAGISHTINTERGFDHGMFLPLKLMFPEASIPVVGLSIVTNSKGKFDAKFHFKIGQVLSLIRNQNVLVLGSGQSFNHTNILLGCDGKEQSFIWDQCLQNIFTNATYSNQQREQLLVDWDQLPFSSLAHPIPDHLMPLIVVAGAGMGNEVDAISFAKIVFDSSDFVGAKMTGILFE